MLSSAFFAFLSYPLLFLSLFFTYLGFSAFLGLYAPEIFSQIDDGLNTSSHVEVSSCPTMRSVFSLPSIMVPMSAEELQAEEMRIAVREARQSSPTSTFSGSEFSTILRKSKLRPHIVLPLLLTLVPYLTICILMVTLSVHCRSENCIFGRSELDRVNIFRGFLFEGQLKLDMHSGSQLISGACLGILGDLLNFIWSLPALKTLSITTSTNPICEVPHVFQKDDMLLGLFYLTIFVWMGSWALLLGKWSMATIMYPLNVSRLEQPASSSSSASMMSSPFDDIVGNRGSLSRMHGVRASEQKTKHLKTP